jgi:hypothetical protein
MLDKTPMLAMPVIYIHLYQSVPDNLVVFLGILLVQSIPDQCAPGGNKTASPLHHNAQSVRSFTVSIQWITLVFLHLHSDSHSFAYYYDAQGKSIMVVHSMKSPQDQL